MAQTTFYGLPLLTAPGRVMRPRPASEQLVATALSFLKQRPGKVVDVETGSGAIAIAIAHAAPQAEVWATDTNPDAAAVARTNVLEHGLQGRVEVRLGSLLDPVPGEIDLVVANLPYLPAADAGRFPDLAGEPPEAVFAPGDGLDPYRQLLAACALRLRAGGGIAIQLHRRVLTASAERLGGLLQEIEGVLEPVLHAGLDDRVAGGLVRSLDEERHRRPAALLGEGHGVDGRSLRLGHAFG
jgi:release factor glutamine methyltransferase